MEICLSKNNKIVKEWFEAVGERETYKQFILHNYALPEYSKYKEIQKEGAMSVSSRDFLLNKFLNSDLFSIDDIQNLKKISDSASAAFWQDVFYFSESVDRKDVAEEAFHAIFQRLTKPEERASLYAIADRLISQRVKKNKLSKKEILRNYEKQLGKAVTWDYVLEEELAKEFVNWVTYDGRVYREQTLREMWADKDISFVDKIIAILKDFFSKVLGLHNANIRYPSLLKDYFKRIERGYYKTSMKIDSEQSITREYPSLSSLVIPSQDGSKDFIMSPADQSYHYGRVLNFVRELSINGVVNDTGTKLTKEEAIKEALIIYRDQVLVNSTNEVGQGLYESLLSNRYNPESVNFGIFVKDLSRRLDQIEQAVSELNLEQEDVEDDIGWNFTDFYDVAPNEKNPQETLTKDLKIIVSNTFIDTGELPVQVKKMVLRDGVFKEETVTLSGKRLIDSSKIINSLISVTSNISDPGKKIKRLIVFTSDVDGNIETKAFFDSFLKDVYRKENGEAITDIDLPALKAQLLQEPLNPKGYVLSNVVKFKKVTKGLNFWTSDILMMSLKKEDKKLHTNIFEPLFTAGVRLQISSWEQNFNEKSLEEKLRIVKEDLFVYEDFLFTSKERRQEETFINNLFQDYLEINSLPLYTELSEENFTDFIAFIANESYNTLSKVLDLYGIEVSKNLKRWIVAEEIMSTQFPGGLQPVLPSSFEMVHSNFQLTSFEYDLNYAHIKEFTERTFELARKEGYIPSTQDPYSLGVSTEDIEIYNLKAELETLARANIYFDETVLPSSFRNPEGKDIYRYQLQSMFLKFSNETILDQELLDNYIQDLIDQEQSNKFYTQGNLFIDFVSNLSIAERKRLSSFSMGGMTYSEVDSHSGRPDPAVSHDVDSASFTAFQLNLMLNKAFIVRQGVRDSDGNYIVPSVITVPYFKGMNELSKTKSFLSSRWFKAVPRIIPQQNGDLIQTEEVLTPLVNMSKEGVFVDMGAVELAKQLLNQDFKRILQEKQALENIANSILTSEVVGDKTTLNLTTELLREKGMESIAQDYHTGTLPLVKTSEGRWKIDWSRISERNVPRSLIIMKDSTYIGDLGREIFYRGIDEGALDVSDISELEALENDLLENITKVVNSTLNRITDKEVIGMLDKAFIEPSDKTLSRNNAAILGFKYSDIKEENTEAIHFTQNKKGKIKAKGKPALQHNLALAIINELFNRQSIQRILHGNIALLNKNNNLEYSKRNKQETSTISPAYTIFEDEAKGVSAFTELKYVVETPAEKANGAKPISGVTGGVIDSNDAQAFTSVWSRKKLLHGLDTLTIPMARILDKIHNGVSLTYEENQRLLKSKSFFNSEKTLGASPLVTLKMSEFMLSKEFTAHKVEVEMEEGKTWSDYVQLENIVRENGDIVSYMIYPVQGARSEYTIEPIIDEENPTIEIALENNNVRLFNWVPVSKELNDRRLILDGWTSDREGGWVYDSLGSRVDLIVPTTASKRMNINVWTGENDKYDAKFHTNTMSTEFYGRQVINISKSEVKDPTQQLDILGSLLPEKISYVNSDGVTIELSKENALSVFNQLKADRDSNAINLFESLATQDGSVNKEILYKIIQETLAETGSDLQLLEFHNVGEDGKIEFNPNLPPIAQKFRNQLSSFIGNNVLSHKVKGDAYAMVTPKGYKVLKKLVKREVAGKTIFTWENVSKNSENYATYLNGASVIPDGLTYNGYEDFVGGKAELNTLQPILQQLYDTAEDKDAIYFLDELRMNKPKLVTNSKGEYLIQNYFAEVAFPPRDMVETKFGLGDNKYIQSVRIPSQSVATSANMEHVDFLPAFYGNSIILAKEIQELAGSDFDIDKVYIHFYDGYYENGTFKKYEDTYKDFKKYLFKSNKIVKKYFNEALEESNEYKQIRKELDNITREIARVKTQIETEAGDSLTPRIKRRLERAVKKLEDSLTILITGEYDSDLAEGIHRTNFEIFNIESILSDFDPYLRRLIEARFKEALNLETRAKELKERSIVTEEQVKEELMNKFFPGLNESNYSIQETYKNPAVINNDILDQKKFLLTANMEAYKDIVTINKLKNILSGDGDPLNDIHGSGKVLKGEIEASFNSMLFDSHYLEGAAVGFGGIGITVMGNLAWRVLSRSNTKLTPAIAFTIKNVPGIGDVEINDFPEELKTTLEPSLISISDRISEIITAATDEAKEGVISRLRLRDDLLSIYLSALSVGIDPQLVTLVLNTPKVQGLITQLYKDRLVDQNKKRVSFRDALNKLIIETLENDYEIEFGASFMANKDSVNYSNLVKGESMDSLFLLDRLYTISEQNRDLLSFIRLKKGLSKDVIDILSYKDSAHKLGLPTVDGVLVQKGNILAYEVDFDKPGFEQYKNYLYNVLPRIEQLYKDLVMELSPNYKELESIIAASTKIEEGNFIRKEIYRGLNRALLGSLISNQKEVLNTNTGDSREYLDISLLYGSNSLANQFLGLKAEPKLRQVLDNNLIFRKLGITLGWQKQVDRVLKMKNFEKAKKQIINLAEADSLSLNLYSKMNPEVQESYQDSFLELLYFNKTDSPELNNKVVKFAESLYHYNLLKDAQEYSPIGIGKVLPTTMFKPLSDLLDTFTTGSINREILEETAERFFRDVRNIDNLATLEDFKSYYKDLNTNFEGTYITFIQSVNSSRSPNYFVKEEKGKKRLFKKIHTEFVDDNGEIKGEKHHYIEVPILGNYSYHASISNTNVVNDRAAAIRAVESARSLYVKTHSQLLKRKLYDEIVKMGELYSIDITTKDGKQATGREVLANDSNFKVSLIPLREENLKRTVYIEEQDNMSPFKIFPKKGLIIGGQKVYSMEHYIYIKKAEFFGDNQLAEGLKGDNISATSYRVEPTIKDVNHPTAWNTQGIDVLEEALREYYDEPSRKKTLLEWKQNGVSLDTNKGYIEQVFPIIYKLMEEVSPNKSLKEPSYSSVIIEKKAEGIPLVLPSLPKNVLDVEMLKAEYADFYLSFSQNKKGTAYLASQATDNKYQNPSPAKTKNKTILLGFNDKRNITVKDLEDYKKAVANYLANGAYIMTNSQHTLNKSLYDTPLTKDKTANGVNSGMRLIDDYLRNELGLKPQIKLIHNEEISIFVNVWHKDHIADMQLQLDLRESDSKQEYTNTESINFQEDKNTGYAARTKINASADATIAIAVDFESVGERLTKKSVIEQGKQYIPISANLLTVTPERVKKIVDRLNSVSARSLNIAGNGIYTMKGKYTQEQVDQFTYDLLNQVLNHPDLKTPIESIRTGGQTGFDEAGAKAGLKLGIPTTILAPKGWKFRNLLGKDISDEKQFKARFEGIKKQEKTLEAVNTVVENKPLGEEVDKGIFVNQNALSKEEQLELFNYIKPLIESQASKTNKGKSAPKMTGLGLRWDYVANNPGRKPVFIPDPIVAEQHKNGYYTTAIDGSPLGEISEGFISLIEKAIGISLEHYDGAIINLYENDSFISLHKDGSESKSASKYPIIAVNLGGEGNLYINDKEVALSAGAGYAFGVNGDNRTAYHRTFPSSGKSFLPSITTKQDGKKYEEGSYRITITMRRVMPLTEGMPTAPAIINTGKPKAFNTARPSELGVTLYSQLGDKTQTEGIEIKPLINLEALNYAKENGMVTTLRVSNTNKHFGNIFTHSSNLAENQGLIKTESIKEAVINYVDWIMTSRFDHLPYFQKPEIKERKEWIRQILASGILKGKTLLYYKELGQPSHATALKYLIENFDSLTGKKQAETPVSPTGEAVPGFEPEAPFTWARSSDNNYEVSSKGDKRFSAFYAQLSDGRYIEDIYQLDIKGNGTAVAKPKADPYNPVKSDITKTRAFTRQVSREQSWEEYKALWRQFLNENPSLEAELKVKARGKVLTDAFASTEVSQARALSELLNERDFPFFDVDYQEEDTSFRKVYIATKDYTRNMPAKHPNIAFVFSENAHSIGSNHPGGNSAIIRGHDNAIGIVTKKSFVYSKDRTPLNKSIWDENYSNTDEDFESFKKVNLRQFEILDNYDQIIFPKGFAVRLAAMPTRFAEWLQKELYDRYGLVTELNETKTGLISKSVENRGIKKAIDDLPDINC